MGHYLQCRRWQNFFDLPFKIFSVFTLLDCICCADKSPWKMIHFIRTLHYLKSLFWENSSALPISRALATSKTLNASKVFFKKLNEKHAPFFWFWFLVFNWGDIIVTVACSDQGSFAKLQWVAVLILTPHICQLTKYILVDLA